MSTPADVVNLGYAARHRTDGFGEGFVESIGHAQAALNTGGLRLAHTLDFDVSPGTGVGGNPALLYSSLAAHPRPILEGQVTLAGVEPAQFNMKLTWNDRDAQAWSALSVTPVQADSYLVAAQIDASLPVEQSGLYPWRLQTQFDVGLAGPVYLEAGDTAEVVVHDYGDLDPDDAFDYEPFYGAGWNLAGVDRLIPHENGDILWTRARGDSRRYTRQPGGTYEPESPSDFGTLVFDPVQVQATYTAKDQTVYTFNHLGLLESIDTPPDPPMLYQYDAEGRLEQVTAPDYAVVTFDYSGFRLSTIHETGSRDVVLTHAGSITRIDDVDGSFRQFTYDGNRHVTSQLWGVIASNYDYDPVSERLEAVDRGLGSVTALSPLAELGLSDPAHAVLPGDRLEAVVTDPLLRIHKRELDREGRLLHETGPDGTLYADSHERTYDRHPDHLLLETYTAPKARARTATTVTAT